MEVLFFTSWMALLTIAPVILMVTIAFLAIDLITIIYEKVESKKSQEQEQESEALFL